MYRIRKKSERNKDMKTKKKFLVAIFLTVVVALAVFVVGCGKRNAGDEDDADANSITITYYVDQSGAPQTKRISKDATSAELLLERPGYAFLGLYDSAEGGMQMFDESGKQLYGFSADVTLYARWSKITYVKAFVAAEHATVNEQNIKVKDGDAVAELPQPEVDYGYTFVGWKAGDLLISDGTMVKDDYMRVNAETASIWFNEDPLVAEMKITEYKITFYRNDGTGNSETIVKNHGERISDIAPLADNETGKMKFVGWSTSMSEYIPYETSPDCDYVTCDLSIYAIWKRWREVTFVIKEGDERVERVYQGEPFTIPDYENPGYVNDGWFRSERFDTVPETKIYYDSAYPKYYSRWEIAVYTIVYHSNSGDTFESRTYCITDSFDLPVPTKAGYVFKGWCEKDDYSDTPVAEISAGCYGNKTLYAKFTGSIVLNAGEGHVSSAKADIVYDKKMTFEVPWLSGYAFAGWFDADGNRVTDSDGKMLEKWDYADLSKALNAKFSEKLYITIEYYYSNSGNVAVAEYYAEGQEVSLRAVAAEGYTFKGFYDTQDRSVSGIDKYTFIMGNADITLKVLFEPAEYTITFNTDGGYCRADKATVKYHCDFVLPIAYKDGKRFDGWLFDGTKITDADGKSVGVWDFLYGGMVKASFVDDDRGMITIKTADEFMKIIEKPDRYYNVLNDIDLSGRNWVPFDFSGTLSGDDVTIKNVFAESDSGNLGIFLKMSGTIKNINFANVVIRSTVYDSVNVGGLCAVLSGSIENVKLLSGSVTGENCAVGGFAAVMENGSIINCENRLDVTGKGNADNCATGGIAGIVKNGTLSDLQNIGKIIGVKYVGGIFGKTSADGVKIERLANHAEIESTGAYVGGVAGYYSRTGEYNMFDFENSGNISGGDYVGGIFGSFQNKTKYRDNNTHITNVKKANNSGNVAAGGNYAGGLFGYLEFEGVGNGNNGYDYRNGKQALNMEEAENSGNVSGVYYVGGLIGYGLTDSEDTLILEGKSCAEIEATAYVGGLMGYASNFLLNAPKNAGSTVIAKGVFASGDNKYAYFGGYVGYGTGMKVNDAANAVEINYQTSLSKGSYVGGLFGYLSGVLTNCTNTAAVTAPNSSYVGGIAGIETQTGEYTMSGLTNTGAIVGSSYVGGIFGSFQNKTKYRDNNTHISNVKKVNNSGNITASGNYAGGLFGYLEFEGVGNGDNGYDYRNGKQALNMEEVENSGDVTGVDYVGGLIGYGKTDSENSEIVLYTQTGKVSGETNTSDLIGKAENLTLTE